MVPDTIVGHGGFQGGRRAKNDVNLKVCNKDDKVSIQTPVAYGGLDKGWP